MNPEIFAGEFKTKLSVATDFLKAMKIHASTCNQKTGILPGYLKRPFSPRGNLVAITLRNYCVKYS